MDGNHLRRLRWLASSFVGRALRVLNVAIVLVSHLLMVFYSCHGLGAAEHISSSQGLAVACIFAFLVLAYYLTTSKVTAKATVLFATTASFGMLVMSMQNLGLIGMMTVAWPDDLNGIFSICQFLLLDIDTYGFSCIAGTSPSSYAFVNLGR